jgi:hypothetical protein
MSISDLSAAIDPHWIDVAIAPASHKMGCKPRTCQLGDHFPILEETEDLIPRGEWDDLIAAQEEDEYLVGAIKDQGDEGTCASNSTTGSREFVWNLNFGKEWFIQLSPISVYRWIAPNGDSGSTISDNLKQIRDVGALPADTPRNREILQLLKLPIKVIKNVGYSQVFPDDWKELATYFRMPEWDDIASFDGMVTNILRKKKPVYGRAGHSIYGVKVVKRNGVYYVKYANSWGSWGENGYGYDSESFISGAIRSYGAFAPRAGVIAEPMALLIRKYLQETRYTQPLIVG